jgi:hypothetical protein
LSVSTITVYQERFEETGGKIPSGFFYAQRFIAYDKPNIPTITGDAIFATLKTPIVWQ